ncbi:ATP-grasp domain-containing protein [Pirellulaceae bacterium SH449]
MIGIHERLGSFSDTWIEYCEEHRIPFKRVDAFASDIICQLSECKGFMWHWHHNDSAAQLFARQLTVSLENMGIKVFPNSNTSWHFDDKVGQKYLLEALCLPLVPSFVFYDQRSARLWVETAKFPIVFKLRGGAGAQNVRLIEDVIQARKIIAKAFSVRGFPAFSLAAYTKQAVWEFRRDRTFLKLARIPYWTIKTLLGKLPPKTRLLPAQKGYVYFQEFIPENLFDDRMVVIGDRCFCVRRYCRKNDFRASGSGVKEYNHENFPRESVALAFEIARKLKTQSVAIDFVYDEKKNPKIVEISYCFVTGSFYEKCDGYFGSEGSWHDKPVQPQRFMIEDFLAELVHLSQDGR